MQGAPVSVEIKKEGKNIKTGKGEQAKTARVSAEEAILICQVRSLFLMNLL